MPERPLATDALTSTNGHALRATPARRRRERGPVWNVVLFLVTCLTTLLAGTSFFGSPTFDAYRASPEPLRWMLSGVPFAATLLGILVVHEFGHYFTARARGAAVSLPFFIPAPPMLFPAGTMGAIIRMRSSARDRNALFDIAAAGPLAGLAVAIPAALLGLAWSTVVPAPPTPHIVFGESLLMHALVWLRFGTLPDGMIVSTHPSAAAASARDARATHRGRAGRARGGRRRRPLSRAARLDVTHSRRQLARARGADPLRARLPPWPDPRPHPAALACSPSRRHRLLRVARADAAAGADAHRLTRRRQRAAPTSRAAAAVGPPAATRLSSASPATKKSPTATNAAR